MAYRVVITAGGKPMVLVGREQCRHVEDGRRCELPARPTPGATRCVEHRWEENATCAEHDRLNCKWSHEEDEPRVPYVPPPKEADRPYVPPKPVYRGMGITCQRFDVDKEFCGNEAHKLAAGHALCVLCLQRFGAWKP